MRPALTRLAQLGWNKRVLTFADFKRATHRDGVFVFPLPTYLEGLYTVRRGHPVIVLSDRLRGDYRDFVAWHEYAHWLLHPQYTHYFVRGTLDKNEYQANVVETIALLLRGPWLKANSTNTTIRRNFGSSGSRFTKPVIYKDYVLT